MAIRVFNEDATRRMYSLARKMGDIFSGENLMLYPIDEGGMSAYERFVYILSDYHKNFMHRTLDQASRERGKELRRIVAVSENRKKISDLSDDVPENELVEMLNPKSYKTALIIESTNSTGISTISGAIFVAQHAAIDAVYQFSITDRLGTTHFCCYPLFLEEDKRYKGPEGRLREEDFKKTFELAKEKGFIQKICPEPPEGYQFPILPDIYKNDNLFTKELHAGINVMHTGRRPLSKRIWRSYASRR